MRKKLKEMTPQELVERAEVLLQRVDDRFKEDGTSSSQWAMTPPACSLAHELLYLASMKLDLQHEERSHERGFWE